MAALARLQTTGQSTFPELSRLETSLGDLPRSRLLPTLLSPAFGECCRALTGESKLDRGGEPVKVPTGQESARPFLPARDFEVCRAFYESLGFNKLLDGDVAIF